MRALTLTLIPVLFPVLFFVPLSAQVDPSPSVRLTWIAASQNPPETTYLVYRSERPCNQSIGADFQLIASAPIVPLTYLDVNVERSRKYCYYVRATNNGVVSAPSNRANAVVPVDAVPVTVTVQP